MFLEEAIWIRDVLTDLRLSAGQLVLDIGSSTEEFRCLSQPFIDYYVFRPLRKMGLKIIHLDNKEDAGVDLVCDFASSEESDGEIIANLPPADVVLCTNFLEHVVDRALVLKRLKKVTKNDGMIIVTVPYLYRYHPDLIDTMYRASNHDLEALFLEKEYTKIRSDILEVAEESFFSPGTKIAFLIRFSSQFLAYFNPRFKARTRQRIRNKVSVLAIRKTIESGSYEA